MPKSRPHPPRPDRRRSIRGSFSWIDHRFLREGFDQGLTRLEKLLFRPGSGQAFGLTSSCWCPRVQRSLSQPEELAPKSSDSGPALFENLCFLESGIYSHREQGDFGQTTRGKLTRGARQVPSATPSRLMRRSHIQISVIPKFASMRDQLTTLIRDRLPEESAADMRAGSSEFLPTVSAKTI